MLFAIPEKDLLFELEAVEFASKKDSGVKSDIIEVQEQIRSDGLEIYFKSGNRTTIQFEDKNLLNKYWVNLVNAMAQVSSYYTHGELPKEELTEEQVNVADQL